jgi:hypothetical protein
LVILAPVAVTAAYAALLALAFRRALTQGDPKAKPGERGLDQLWKGEGRKRIVTLAGIYLGLALVGGIVGSLIASRRGDTTFAALAWASFLGQVTLIVTAIVVVALYRRFVTMRGIRP